MSMTCHASGGLLATGGAGGSERELGGVIKVWDVDSGSCTHQFKGHHGVITSIVFHPDPKQLLVSYPKQHDYLCMCKSYLLPVLLALGINILFLSHFLF